MKKTLFLMVIFLNFGCKPTSLIIVNDGELKITIQEFETILQNILDLNSLDYLFTEDDKSEGLTIVINDFIQPYYKSINLIKFDKKVQFLTHHQVYENENEKFFDILEGSIIKKNDTLNIMLGLRYKYTAIDAQFIKRDNKWAIIDKSVNVNSSYLPTYHFAMDKEQCLAEQIKELKLNKNSPYKCSKYRFQ